MTMGQPHTNDNGKPMAQHVHTISLNPVRDIHDFVPASSTPADNGGWSCPACTFFNTSSDFLACEICGETKPVPETPAVPAETSPAPTTLQTEEEEQLMRGRQERVEKEHQSLIRDRMKEIMEMQQQIWDEQTSQVNVQEEQERQKILELEQRKKRELERERAQLRLQEEELQVRQQQLLQQRQQLDEQEQAIIMLSGPSASTINMGSDEQEKQRARPEDPQDEPRPGATAMPGPESSFYSPVSRDQSVRHKKYDELEQELRTLEEQRTPTRTINATSVPTTPEEKLLFLDQERHQLESRIQQTSPAMPRPSGPFPAPQARTLSGRTLSMTPNQRAEMLLQAQEASQQQQRQLAASSIQEPSRAVSARMPPPLARVATQPLPQPQQMHRNAAPPPPPNNRCASDEILTSRTEVRQTTHRPQTTNRAPLISSSEDEDDEQLGPSSTPMVPCVPIPTSPPVATATPETTERKGGRRFGFLGRKNRRQDAPTSPRAQRPSNASTHAQRQQRNPSGTRAPPNVPTLGQRMSSSMMLSNPENQHLSPNASPVRSAPRQGVRATHSSSASRQATRVTDRMIEDCSTPMASAEFSLTRSDESLPPPPPPDARRVQSGGRSNLGQRMSSVMQMNSAESRSRSPSPRQTVYKKGLRATRDPRQNSAAHETMAAMDQWMDGGSVPLSGSSDDSSPPMVQMMASESAPFYLEPGQGDMCPEPVVRANRRASTTQLANPATAQRDPRRNSLAHEAIGGFDTLIDGPSTERRNGRRGRR